VSDSLAASEGDGEGAHHPAVIEQQPAAGIPTMAKRPATSTNSAPEAHDWITLATGEYYPDILTDACLLYSPVLELFGQLVRSSETSDRLFRQITDVRSSWMRIQLCRVFKRYVSPATPVEMLKRKIDLNNIIERFGRDFRPVQEVQAAYNRRPNPDEPLCALLWEYKDRGKKGYDLTERFFDLFRSRFPDIPIQGPERAGRDVLMREVFADYPNPDRPVDFVIYNKDKSTVLAIGLARYDGDRGGAQEDDRTGGYRDVAREIFTYARSREESLKLIFLNDGPGLLLGTMWRDYARLELSWKGKIMITTLRMIPQRLTLQWLAAEVR
jgi:hypothetical protein